MIIIGSIAISIRLLIQTTKRFHTICVRIFLLALTYSLIFCFASSRALPSVTLVPGRTPYRMMCPEQLDVILATDGMSIQTADLKIYLSTGDLAFGLGSIWSQNTSLFPSSSFAPGWMNTLYGDIALQLGVSRVGGFTLGGRIGSYMFASRPGITQTPIDRYLASNGTKLGGIPFVAGGTGIYTFVAMPCVDDTLSPLISSYIGTGGSSAIPIVSSLQSISSLSGLWLTITEPLGLPVSYGRSGGIYTGVSGRTNQWGINSGTLSLSIVKRSGSIGGSMAWSRILTGGNFSIIPNNPLSISGYGKSRSDDYLDYALSISGSELVDRGIENAIQLYVEARDKSPTAFSPPFSGNKTISNSQFNLPQVPTLSQPFPAPGATHIPSQTQVRFRLDDSRGGINTGSIRVQLSGVGYTGSSQIFSGNDLSCILVTGTPLPGGAGGYQCTLSATRIGYLPTPGVTMTATVWFDDLADVPNSNNSSRSWVTRNSCSTYNCGEPLQIYIPGSGRLRYTGGNELIITGGNNPTYTGLRNGLGTGIIDCKLSGYNTTGLHIQAVRSGGTPRSIVSTSSLLIMSGDANTTYLALSGDTLWIKKKLQTSLTYSPPAASGWTSGDVVATLIVTGGRLTGFDSMIRSDNGSGVYVFTATRNTGFTLRFEDQYGELSTGGLLIRWIDKSVRTPYVIEVRPEKRVNSGSNRSTYGIVEFSQSGNIIFSTGVSINNYGTGGFMFPFVDSGVFDIGFRSWSHLRSIDRSFPIFTGPQYIDITSGGVRFLFFGDFLWDNTVDSFDLGVLLGRYGSTTDIITDADLDGAVDSFDLGMFLGNYGMTGEDF